MKALEKFCNWFKISCSIMPCLTAVSSGNGVGAYRLAAPKPHSSNKPGGLQSEELPPAHVLWRTNKVSLGCVSQCTPGTVMMYQNRQKMLCWKGRGVAVQMKLCLHSQEPTAASEGTACSILLQ